MGNYEKTVLPIMYEIYLKFHDLPNERISYARSYANCESYKYGVEHIAVCFYVTDASEIPASRMKS